LDESELIALVHAAAEEEETISGLIAEDVRAESADFSRMEADSGIFRGGTFLSCGFSHTSFTNVRFERCNFSNSNFSDAYFASCKFIGCKFVGCDFTDALIKHSEFSGCNCSIGTDFVSR
jgi:uncharacterized protein YjbI with pentapeptide repeats